MKPIEHDGPTAAVAKPLRLRRYEAGGLPDPAACVDALAIGNDRGTRQLPRPHMADGSTWHALAYVADVEDLAARIAQRSDLTPLVRPAVEEAVRAMLPALMPPALPAARPTALPAPSAPADDDVRALAGHMMQMVETINDLGRRLAEAEERIAFLEKRALARVELEGAT